MPLVDEVIEAPVKVFQIFPAYHTLSDLRKQEVLNALANWIEEERTKFF
ncbi:MAG: hypothetical protein WC052_05120 [Patescibacteria group bacterium]